jgi:1-deoxy-D-xylulose-5-phosphate synthase
VVAIFGDAALTNGISFEALNNLAHTTKRFIGILNDNEWSIAKNVGAISTYLNKLITHPSYNKLAKDFERFVRRLPKGELALKLAHKAEESFKGALTEVGLEPRQVALDADGRGGYGSSLIFEEMGLRYLGPIDGHDLPLVISTLEFAKTCDHPIVIHVLTQKGKGFEAALKTRKSSMGLDPTTSPRARPPRPSPAPRRIGRTSLAGPWSSFARRTTPLSASPPPCPPARA